ncbi:MAG TPA: hypothetical protein VEM32_05175 [Geobacteraceae bacterium]|nr:hypothetical protein [Geobacteraceae bacterium]
MKREILDVEKKALADYRDGSISLGKLAEIIGLDPVSACRYIQEHGIIVACQELDEIMVDSENA